MTYVRGSSIVSHRSSAARSTLSTASIRRCAFPRVPGPAPMNSPLGSDSAAGSTSVKDSNSTMVATMASDLVMDMNDTRSGVLGFILGFFFSREEAPSPSIKSVTRSTETSRDVSRPKIGSS